MGRSEDVRGHHRLFQLYRLSLDPAFQGQAGWSQAPIRGFDVSPCSVPQIPLSRWGYSPGTHAASAGCSWRGSEMSSCRLTSVLKNSFNIAVVHSGEDLARFATFELLHASHGGLRARKQIYSVRGGMRLFRESAIVLQLSGRKRSVILITMSRKEGDHGLASRAVDRGRATRC
jgi:hypothetical protein